MDTKKVVEAGIDFARTPYGTVRASGGEIHIRANPHQLLDWKNETGEADLKSRKLIARVNIEDGSVIQTVPEVSPQVVEAWLDDVLSEALSLNAATTKTTRRRRWGSRHLSKRRKSRLEAVVERAQTAGLVVDERVGEDHIRRIRFGTGTEQGTGFEEMQPIFTAMGIKEAETWLAGYTIGREPLSE